MQGEVGSLAKSFGARELCSAWRGAGLRFFDGIQYLTRAYWQYQELESNRYEREEVCVRRNRSANIFGND